MAKRPISPARAAASRRNGARSGGPTTAAGKARSARNALKHGLRARHTTTMADEDGAAFEDLTRALGAELAPAGALQAELVERLASALWRARRVDRLEIALLGRHLAPTARSGDPEQALGAGLIRDGHGPRALETLVRYRGAVIAELFRSLGALRVLQTASDHDRDLPLPVESRTPGTKPTRARSRKQPLGSRA